MAIRAVCGQLTAAQLQDMQRSVELARLLPKRTGWDRKAAAHAEIFALRDRLYRRVGEAAADTAAIRRILRTARMTGHPLSWCDAASPCLPVSARCDK
jgi:hypothetical protein